MSKRGQSKNKAERDVKRALKRIRKEHARRTNVIKSQGNLDKVVRR
jgi:hypothetical protein